MQKIYVLVIVFLSLAVGGCVSGYKQFYKPLPWATPDAVASLRTAPPTDNPLIERSQPSDSQAVTDAYLKRGYVVIGTSMFNSGRSESEESAIEQAREIKADLVLVLNPRYTGSVTSSIPITSPTAVTSYSTATATAYGPGVMVNAYGRETTTTYGSKTTYIPMVTQRSDFGAVYFIKQRFILGALSRNLNDSERQEMQTNKGVVIRLVVDNSPAFNADLLPGDVLVSLDGMAITNADSLSDLLRERTGKIVNIEFLRRGQRIEKSIQLNS
ncbi:MAG: PDZ domain-containing protein [Gammaproteobacteria bacterium]|nr:PDZ domain-containing protein [Gammaproteobacteria bacterium]